MKSILLFLMLSCASILSAQEASHFVENNNDRHRDPRADQINFVPNEVLVKFKDNVTIQGGTNLKSAGISSIDQILKANGVNSLQKLFPAEKQLKSVQILKDPTGRDMKIPSLHNIYRITVPQLKSTGSAPADIFKFIEELKVLPEVEYAEPNFVFSIGDYYPTGREMTMLEAMNQPENQELKSTATGIVPNDPLYNSQWGIPACNIDDVWNTTTGDSTAIIAILDTGVDWQHPDLAKNIWKNKQEIAGNGKDDDGNGLIDDIRGWDFINNDNNPMDDNSHGTHVAGIAAAVGNNGIGIAGANWKAKIMPIKVFQSSGRGDAATIAQGVIYAATKGATVINMSFGSYAESLTMKNALANAYATAVLVAAAGNDATPIGPCRMGCAPMYPGAYSFVLGVEANKQLPAACDEGGPSIIRACFSNFDQDGPIFSGYSDLLNYELKAPGEAILSCVPGGNYREYSGTSMATPLVAGAVSLYRKLKPTESQELLFGNLINSINQHIDLQAALNIIPEPKLDIVSYTVTDTIDGDRDGRPDVGETIELKVKVRNTWGQANDVKVGLEFGEFEDHSTATILTPEASIGSISTYATKENIVSLKLKISANVSNNRDLVFNLKAWYGNKQGLTTSPLILNIENGFQVGGVITSNTTWDPSKVYLVKDFLKIVSGVTLTILPGTTVIFYEGKGIDLQGSLVANGLPDKMIIFEGYPEGVGKGIYNGSNTSSLILSYCIFQNLETSYNLMTGPYHQNISNCIFKNLNNLPGYTDYGFFEKNLIMDNYNVWQILGANSYTGNEYYDCHFRDNIIVRNSTAIREAVMILGDSHFTAINNSFKNNSIYSNYSSSGSKEINAYAYFSSIPDIARIGLNYWGRTDSIKIKSTILDFMSLGQGPFAVISPILTQPSIDAHGHVWKVLVNGNMLLDDYEKADPLGVARQKFEIYFNRPMDPQYPPTVSMGVRSPYTQTVIAEDGSWNADATVYTVYGTVGLNTGDGINNIRVSGTKDLDHFEIPIEDQRFRVIVNAAGSASAQFQASPGLGKVKLEWNNNKLADGLGFNMYRMEKLNDTTLTTPVMINSSLIIDTLYTDFAVTPNKKYYYYYKILRTNLTETDSSKVVATTPFTATKGDANGDLSVNVLDVTTIVAYLLNNNPQPFIAEAADVNSDGNINVLDIVGVVNLVLGNKSAVMTTTEKVQLYMQNDTLFADAPVAIGGIQFDISGVSAVEEIQRLKALEGFESGYSQKDNSLRLIYYSLSGKTVPAGKRIPLLRMKKGTGITNIIFGDKSGSPLQVNYLSTGIWNLSDNLNQSVAALGQNFPNPLTNQTTIPIHINEPVDEAVIRIVNVMGQEVDVIRLSNPAVGEHMLSWISGNNKGFFAYLLEIRRGNQQFVCPVRKMVVQ